MYEHLEPLRKKLLGLDLATPPLPWRLIASLAIGGLRAVGFDQCSDLLLIVSSQGRGVVNGLTGETIARDRGEYEEEEVRLEAMGIGVLGDRIIRIAGLCGGGLPLGTEDGWRLASVTLNRPEQSIMLISPGSDLYGGVFGYPDEMTKVALDSSVVAYGFSSTGRSFVIATTSGIDVFGR
jgi:hypothetical protein